MANTDRTTGTTSVPQETTRRQSNALSRRDPFGSFMDRFFEDVGLGRNWLQRAPEVTQFSPQIEVFQRGNDLVVRADLPGLKKEDVNVDITDDEVTISGERRQEQETTERGVYRSERSYGSFTRAIRLPEGAMTDQAKATFKDGVLEIRMPAPPDQVTRGRRLDIKEGTDAKK